MLVLFLPLPNPNRACAAVSGRKEAAAKPQIKQMT